MKRHFLLKIRCVLILSFVFLYIGCAHHHHTNQHPIALTPEMFVDYEYKLMDSSKIENYNFGEADVVASLGNKEGVMRPILNWKILENNTLLIYNNDSVRIQLQFKKMEMTNAVTIDGRQFSRNKFKF